MLRGGGRRGRGRSGGRHYPSYHPPPNHPNHPNHPHSGAQPPPTHPTATGGPPNPPPTQTPPRSSAASDDQEEGEVLSPSPSMEDGGYNYNNHNNNQNSSYNNNNNHPAPHRGGWRGRPSYRGGGGRHSAHPGRGGRNNNDSNIPNRLDQPPPPSSAASHPHMPSRGRGGGGRDGGRDDGGSATLATLPPRNQPDAREEESNNSITRGGGGGGQHEDDTLSFSDPFRGGMNRGGGGRARGGGGGRIPYGARGRGRGRMYMATGRGRGGRSLDWNSSNNNNNNNAETGSMSSFEERGSGGGLGGRFRGRGGRGMVFGRGRGRGRYDSNTNYPSFPLHGKRRRDDESSLDHETKRFRDAAPSFGSEGEILPNDESQQHPAHESSMERHDKSPAGNRHPGLDKPLSEARRGSAATSPSEPRKPPPSTTSLPRFDSETNDTGASRQISPSSPSRDAGLGNYASLESEKPTREELSFQNTTSMDFSEHAATEAVRPPHFVVAEKVVTTMGQHTLLADEEVPDVKMIKETNHPLPPEIPVATAKQEDHNYKDMTHGTDEEPNLGAGHSSRPISIESQPTVPLCPDKRENPMTKAPPLAQDGEEEHHERYNSSTQKERGENSVNRSWQKVDPEKHERDGNAGRNMRQDYGGNRQMSSNMQEREELNSNRNQHATTYDNGSRNVSGVPFRSSGLDLSHDRRKESSSSLPWQNNRRDFGQSTTPSGRYAGSGDSRPPMAVAQTGYAALANLPGPLASPRNTTKVLLPPPPPSALRSGSSEPSAGGPSEGFSESHSADQVDDVKSYRPLADSLHGDTLRPPTGNAMARDGVNPSPYGPPVPSPSAGAHSNSHETSAYQPPSPRTNEFLRQPFDGGGRGQSFYGGRGRGRGGRNYGRGGDFLAMGGRGGRGRGGTGRVPLPPIEAAMMQEKREGAGLRGMGDILPGVLPGHGGRPVESTVSRDIRAGRLDSGPNPGEAQEGARAVDGAGDLSIQMGGFANDGGRGFGGRSSFDNYGGRGRGAYGRMGGRGRQRDFGRGGRGRAGRAWDQGSRTPRPWEQNMPQQGYQASHISPPHVPSHTVSNTFAMMSETQDAPFRRRLSNESGPTASLSLPPPPLYASGRDGPQDVPDGYAQLSQLPPPQLSPITVTSTGVRATPVADENIKYATTPTPPPPRAPTPPPSEPSGLVLAMTRLAHMEEEMNFAYARHMRLIAKQAKLRASYKQLESYPVGLEAIEEDLQAFLQAKGLTTESVSSQ